MVQTNVDRILVWKYERNGWITIKWILKKWGVPMWIGLVLDRDQWQGIVNTLRSIYLNAQPTVFKSQGRLKHPLGNKTLVHILRNIYFNLWQKET
jgi:hypothetical protein